MIPPPMPRHSRASKRLAAAVDAALPEGYESLQEVGVDLLLAPHRAGEFGYADGGEVTGRFRTDQQFELELELARLL